MTESDALPRIASRMIARRIRSTRPLFCESTRRNPSPAEEAISSMNCSSLISPAARSARAFQTMVPEPVRSPRNQPFSIGPPESTMAGISTVAAAISCAGVVLSQPVVSTTPSMK